jgi:hypothetical protein
MQMARRLECGLPGSRNRTGSYPERIGLMYIGIGTIVLIIIIVLVVMFLRRA